MGDPHYRTFDGNYYNFMGSCTYTMVKNCDSDGTHPNFEVDAQNRKQAGSKVTFVGKVVIKVYGYTITIVESEFGLVRMNYTLWNLPISLDNGKVKLSLSGLSVLVETDFGLIVQYDWKQHLVITVPGSLSGKVCGLCGNFNDKKEDDLVTSNGTLTNSVVVLGKSWRVPSEEDDAQCKDECTGQCETCDKESILGSYADRIFCDGLSIAMTGPLSDCKALIDPRVFHEMCLFDVCMGQRIKDFLCNTLQVYADSCQRAGIKIYNWRRLAHCDAATRCNKSCVETCVCDKDFLLSGTECVPKDQCGCLYKGHYIEAGASFLSDDNCDPHYKTFDQKKYDFQGTCTYTAAKSCHLEGTRLKSFSVVVENDKWTLTDQPHLAVTKVVVVEVYGYTLVLRRNQRDVVMVNGTLTRIPFYLDDKKVHVFQEGTHYAIITDFGLNVTYDLVYHVTITVPGNYKGKMCGLCGNYNGNKTDDFQLQHGGVTTAPQIFGASWKVSVPGVVCEDGCVGDRCPKCDVARKEIFEKYCGRITDKTGAFAACHNQLNPVFYYRDCVYDLCMAHGDRKVLCDSIAAYVTDCQEMGARVDNWRTKDFCPLECPANSHYQICPGKPVSPCPGLTDMIPYPDRCAEGCTCNNGYHFNGTGCVALDDCSCYHEGRTLEIGESSLSDHCQRKCSCTTSGRVHCEDFSCNATETCKIKNGVQGCHPKECRLETGGSITLFSGMTGTVSVMGVYEIIAHCDPSSVDWFRVVVKLYECALTGVRRVGAVYVYFNDLSITVNDQQETWVNGKQVTLPILPRMNVSVRVSEGTIIIEKLSHFQLYFSETQEVIITVSDSMADSVCGACGEFLSLNEVISFSQEAMLEYMAVFIAQDFPVW
ncbi:IgGFc-binding protein-like [Aulostomus maculatus]